MAVIFQYAWSVESHKMEAGSDLRPWNSWLDTEKFKKGLQHSLVITH